MPAAIQQTAPVFKIDGSDFAAADLGKLTGVRVERGYCTVSRATLRFADAGFAISTSGTFAIGKSVSVTERESKQVLFEGEITSVSLEQGHDYIPELVVVADDHLHRLARTSITATYLQMKASDVIQKAASSAGLSTDIAATTVVFDYLIQGGTALAYIDQLATRAGMVWWCEYPRKLKVAKPDSGSGPKVDFDLADDALGVRTFSVRASARNISSVTVTGWDLKQTEKVVGTATTNRTKESTFVDLAKAESFGTSKLTRSDLAPLTQKEATTLAEAINKDAASQSVTARGTGPGDGRLEPGTKVAVQNAGPASGTYLVTEVEHRYDRTGFTTTFVAGSFRREGLVDLLAAPTSEPGFTLDNVITGVVTNIDDPDKLGRVKVKFPSIAEEPESEWARVVTVGGGPDRGALFLPEVNDEVLVAFERGDTRRPIVLGGLFSTKNGFPGDNPVKDGLVDVRRLTSRVGHLVELCDRSGEEYVLIQHGKKKHSVKFENDKVDITADSVPIKMSNGQAFIELKANGDIVIDGKNITIKGQMDVKVEGLNVQAKAQANAGLEGGAALALKGNASADLQAGGVLNLKGAKVGING